MSRCLSRREEITLLEATILIGGGVVALGFAFCTLFPDVTKAALAGAFSFVGADLAADVIIHKHQQLQMHQMHPIGRP